jgi:3-methyladenine DNA glycosylase AlkD
VIVVIAVFQKNNFGPTMSLPLLLTELSALPRKAEGRAYFPAIKLIARRIGIDHALALKLWRSGDRDARSLATLIADPEKLDGTLLESWIADTDDWSLCDGVSALVCVRPFARQKIKAWARRDEEFVKRAAFATIAQAAWSKKRGQGWDFLAYLPLIERHAADDRFYVKKGVNWALRDIGKRSKDLYKPALALAEKLSQSPDSTARWIGRDAWRDLKARGHKD